MRPALFLTLLSILTMFLLFGVDCKHSTEPLIVAEDSTSHDMVWTVDSVGNGVNPSMLIDASIVNDTCAWAVGEVYMCDSLGNEINNAFGAAVYNGSEWKPIQVAYHDFGLTELWPGPLRSIIAFRGNAVYAATYAGVLLWEGSAWTEKAFFMTGTPFEGQINKMWAGDESVIYCVGRTGSIYRYNAYGWAKQESGTTVTLLDITGYGNSIWACGVSADAANSVLLMGDAGAWTWKEVWSRKGGATAPFGDLVTSVWASAKYLYVASSSGVYRIRHGDPVANAEKMVTLGSYPYCIRGSGDNDVFVVGDNAMIWHYNGSSWKQLNSGSSSQPLYGLSVSKSIVVAVGSNFASFPSRATVYVAHRY